VGFEADGMDSLAYVELRLIIAEIVWNFDMQLLSGRDWPKQRSYLVWGKKPLMVKFTKVVR
jgi:cytochrome P450